MRRELLAFSTLFARFDPAKMPILILRMGGAEPALAPIAENGGGFVAGLIQARNAFARGFCFLLARLCACRLRFHPAPCGDCTLPWNDRRNFLGSQTAAAFGGAGRGVLGFGCAKKRPGNAPRKPQRRVRSLPHVLSLLSGRERFLCRPSRCPQGNRRTTWRHEKQRRKLKISRWKSNWRTRRILMTPLCFTPWRHTSWPLPVTNTHTF